MLDVPARGPARRPEGLHALGDPAHRHRSRDEQGHLPRRGAPGHARHPRRPGRSGTGRDILDRAAHEARDRRGEHRGPGGPARRRRDGHGGRRRAHRHRRSLRWFHPHPPGLTLPAGGARGLRCAGRLPWGGARRSEVWPYPSAGARRRGAAGRSLPRRGRGPDRRSRHRMGLSGPARTTVPSSMP